MNILGPLGYWLLNKSRHVVQVCDTNLVLERKFVVNLPLDSLPFLKVNLYTLQLRLL